MKQFLWRWLPLLAWMGLIFYLSAQPDLPQAPGVWLDTLIKKTSHALGYGVLAWLYRRALQGHIRNPDPLRIVSVGLAVAYALSDEYHQTFVPGRKGNLLDVAVDGVGAGVAMLLDRWWEGRQELSRRPPAAQ